MRIPIPTFQEDEKIPEVKTQFNTEWIHEFLNVPPWKCVCGLTNFGRNEQCAKCKKERLT